MTKETLEINIKTLESKNGLRQRYLNHYIGNGNLSQYAFQAAIARDEMNIIKAKQSILDLREKNNHTT